MSWLYNLVEDFKEIKKDGKRKKRKPSPDVTAVVVSDNGTETEYKAQLFPGNLFLFIDDLERVHFNPKIYDNGKTRKVYVPEGNHDGKHTNFSIQMAKATNVDALLKWKYKSVWHSIRLTDIKGCIDWNLLDNDISPNFAVNGFDIFKAKILEYLSVAGGKETNMAMLVGACMGIIGIEILKWVAEVILTLLA